MTCFNRTKTWQETIKFKFEELLKNVYHLNMKWRWWPCLTRIHRSGIASSSFYINDKQENNIALAIVLICQAVSSLSISCKVSLGCKTMSHYLYLEIFETLFLYFCLFNTVNSKQINVRYKSLPMIRFEPRTSGIQSNRSTNWATTIAQWYACLIAMFKNKLNILL